MLSLKSESVNAQTRSSLKTSDSAFVISFGKWRTKVDAKGRQQILKRQFGEDNICWKVNRFVFKLKPRCITIFVVGNNPVSWPMHPNCRNWCPATTLGMFFWVWFDLWRLPRETVSKSCSLLKVMLLFYNKLVHSLSMMIMQDSLTGGNRKQERD